MATITHPERSVFLLKTLPVLRLTMWSVHGGPGTAITAQAADHHEEVVLPGHRASLQRVLKLFAAGGVVTLILLANMPLQAHANPLAPKVSYSSNVLGSPTVSVAFINQVLKTYHSPAAGKGLALYEDGVTYGIDPVFALAFFMHESSFGTAGVARVTLSLGNIRCTRGYPSCYKGYRAYSSWEDGFVDWYKLIRNVYIGQWNLRTVDQIIPVYAPASENNVQAYIAAVKHAINTWRAGQVIVQ